MRCECGRSMKNHEVEYYDETWGIEKFCDLCDMGIFEGTTLDGSTALENQDRDDAALRGAATRVWMRGRGAKQKLYLAEWAEGNLPDEAFAFVDGEDRKFPHHGVDGTVEVERVREGMKRIRWIDDPIMKEEVLGHLDGHLKEWMRRGVLSAYGARSRMFPESRNC